MLDLELKVESHDICLCSAWNIKEDLIIIILDYDDQEETSEN